MLDFFRKYQRYLFLITSVMVISSFSFFGTFSTLSTDPAKSEKAITAINGKEIKIHELDEMVAFLSTDSDDKRLFGGKWGPNFLNDGVIKKDFLETGLALVLAEAFPSDIQQDLQGRLEKEKSFTLYSHPQAKFLNTETAWAYFAPKMKLYFDELREASNPLDQEALNARINLFLAEKKFSSSMLRQVLNYQEKQYSWLTPDPQLAYADLSLFGYHSTEDWFGPRFIRLIAQFIINSAIEAEQKGYEVSKAEVIADLTKNSAMSYQQNLKSPYLGVTNGKEYYDKQLLMMGMDQNKAIKVWRQVMLFRRLFNDVGHSVVVSPLPYKEISAYAKADIEGEVYHLPKELQLKDYRSLQKLEVYLKAVSPKTQEGDLLPPKTFSSIEEVSKKYPELIQQRYLVEITEAQKSSQQARVTLKETWNWEMEDSHWDKLKKEFPELAVKKGDSREERFTILDGLDERTRARVDAFARSAIIDAHPEWMEQALDNSEPKKVIVGLRKEGGSFSFKGVKDRQEIISLLNQAALRDQTENEASHKLNFYTGDHENFYRIKLIDRAPGQEVLTFAEANQEGVLDGLLDKQLKSYYDKIKETNPEFQNVDRSPKPFEEVKDQVADLYFAKKLKAIQKDYAAAIAPEAPPTIYLGDFTATLRFYAYMRDAKEKIKKDPAAIASLVNEKKPEGLENQLTIHRELADQWKLDKGFYHTDRSAEGASFEKGDMFGLAENDWSKVYLPANGDLYFFQLKKKEEGSFTENELAKKMKILQELVSNDAQRHYMSKFIDLLKEKNAISLDYMSISREPTIEPEGT